MTISETTKFTMGCEVRCTDGVCGTLRRVVVDPVARTLTHLVVEPEHRECDGHLVPIALVSFAGSEIELCCPLAEFERLECAQEVRFLPGAQGQWDHHHEEMLSWPYVGRGSARAGAGIGGAGWNLNPNNNDRATAYVHVPAGEIQVRRGEHVHAVDGPIGRVQGLAVDPGDHHVIHVLLDEGHLWELKQVAIPIGSVTSVDDGVRLDLTKDQVRDLPPLALDEKE